jgi:methylmalonyl-CoA mutase
MAESRRAGRLFAFPAVSADSWRARVLGSLADGSMDQLVSRSPDGIEIQPLYAAEDVRRAGAARGPERGAGRAATDGGWILAQEHDRIDPDVLSDRLREDEKRGVECVWIRLGHGGRTDRGSGLRAALAAVELQRTMVVLEAGPAAPELAVELAELARSRDLDPGGLRGGVLCDPIGLGASRARPTAMDEAYTALGEATAWAEREGVGIATMLASDRPFHDAGATPASELALVIAGAIEHLRALERHGIELASTGRRLVLELSISDDQFLEAAKLRAARLLWAGVAEDLGLRERAPWVHARTSARGHTPDDPWADVLRATMRTFAAVVGGADSIATRAFDQGALARRMATNTQLVLREESHLGRVADPGGGSYYLEVLTDLVARRAWDLVRRLEQGGGLRARVASGATAANLVAELGPGATATATREGP